MPPVPSLKSAFSGLMSASGPSLAPTPMGQSTPATLGVSPILGKSAPTPAIPALSQFSVKPVAPTLSSTMNSQSQGTALQAGQFGSTPALPSLSTPTVGKTTTVPTATTTASTPPIPTIASSYVTTPSGAVVDPNTGSLITAAPTGNIVDQNTAGGVTTDNTGNAGGSTNYSTSAGGSGAPGTNPLLNNATDEAAYQAYLATLNPGSDELSAMTNLANLNTSATQAYTNAAGQAIPLDFITGQQAAIQRSQAALASPLEAQLTLSQAKRQMATTASKAALDREDAKLAAARDLAKPISTAYGGTTSRYNPATGQYETVVNPFGTATGTTNGTDTGTGTTDVIGQAIADGRLTADMVTRYGIPFLASTLQKDPGYNFVTQKASTAATTTSLTDATKYATTVQRSFNTANDNLKNLISYMTTAGINGSSTIPLINDLTNKVKAGVTDAGTIAGFQSALAGLRAEYAQVLSRGGEVTDSSRNSAASLIPDNITPAQLQQVADRLNAEGQNAITEANATVTKLKASVGSNPGGSSSGTSGSGTVVQTKAGPVSTDW